MGKAIDHDHRYTQEEREYLASRSRGYLIPINERRFGTEEEPINDHLQGPQVSQTYDNSVREKAVYDVGGAPLPDATLDYNTGRVMDRDNGKLVEYSGPGHVPGASDLRIDGIRQPYSGFDGDGIAVDENGNPVEEIDIDEDIAKFVLSLANKTELKKALIANGAEAPEKVSDVEREELENDLAIALQDKRNAGEEVDVPAVEPEPADA